MRKLITILFLLLIVTGISGCTNYAIGGVIQNNFGEDTKYVKMHAVTFDKADKIVTINDTVELSPKTVQAKGKSNFYFDFHDPDNRIVRYELKIVDAR